MNKSLFIRLFTALSTLFVCLAIVLATPIGTLGLARWINWQYSDLVELKGITGNLISTINIQEIHIHNYHLDSLGENVTLHIDWPTLRQKQIRLQIDNIDRLTIEPGAKLASKTLHLFTPRLLRQAKTPRQLLETILMQPCQITIEHGRGSWVWSPLTHQRITHLSWQIHHQAWLMHVTQNPRHLDVHIDTVLQKKIQPVLSFQAIDGNGQLKNYYPILGHRLKLKYSSNQVTEGQLAIAPWTQNHPPSNALNLSLKWQSQGAYFTIKTEQLWLQLRHKNFKGNALIQRQPQGGMADINLIGKEDHLTMHLQRGSDKDLRADILVTDLSHWSRHLKGHLHLQLNYLDNKEHQPQVLIKLKGNHLDIRSVQLESTNVALHINFSDLNQIKGYWSLQDLRINNIHLNQIKTTISPDQKGIKITNHIDSDGLSCVSHWHLQTLHQKLQLELSQLNIFGFDQGHLEKPAQISLSSKRIIGEPICIHDTEGEGTLCAQIHWQVHHPWSLDVSVKHWHSDQLILIKQLIGLTLLDGYIDGHLTLQGKTVSPRLIGHFTIHDFNIIHISGYQMSGQALTMDLKADNTHVGRSNYHATLEQTKGKLSIDGQLQFLPSFLFDAHMKGDHITLRFITSGTQLEVKPDITYRLEGDHGDFRGNVEVETGVIDLRHAMNTQSLPVEVEVKRSSINHQLSMRSNMHLLLKTGKQPLELKHHYLDAKLQGQLLLSKPERDSMIAEGQLNISEANLKRYNDIAQIKQAALYYNGNELDDPQVYFKLEKTTYDFNFNNTAPTMVGLEVRGSLDNYSVSFYSYPQTLPTSQIVILLFTGAETDPTDNRDNDNDDQSSLLTTLVKHGLGNLPMGGEGPLTRMAHSLSVNELSLDPEFEDNSSGESLYDTYVVVGKQLMKKVYLRYRYGITHADNMVYLIYRLINGWRLEGYCANTYNDGDSCGVNLLYNFN